jgi:hypothetical protein
MYVVHMCTTLPTYLMAGAQVLGLMALRESGSIVQLIVRRVDIQEQHTAQLQQHALVHSTVRICHRLHSNQ